MNFPKITPAIVTSALATLNGKSMGRGVIMTALLPAWGFINIAPYFIADTSIEAIIAGNDGHHAVTATFFKNFLAGCMAFYFADNGSPIGRGAIIGVVITVTLFVHTAPYLFGGLNLGQHHASTLVYTEALTTAFTAFYFVTRSEGN